MWWYILWEANQVSNLKTMAPKPKTLKKLKRRKPAWPSLFLRTRNKSKAYNLVYIQGKKRVASVFFSLCFDNFPGTISWWGVIVGSSPLWGQKSVYTGDILSDSCCCPPPPFKFIFDALLRNNLEFGWQDNIRVQLPPLILFFSFMS